MPTTSFTATIDDITQVSPGVWRIALAENSALLSIPEGDALVPGNVSSKPLILDPFINEANIINHPYNVLLNNALTSTNSANVQKLDYSDNPNTPINIEAIRNNTAEKADVSEYLYNSRGMYRARYGGSKLTSAELNKFRYSDKSYGAKPVVEHTSPYFVYFNWIGGTSPDLPRKTAAQIRYIIDLEGNAFSPEDSVEVISIVQQTFQDQSKVIINLDNPTQSGINMSSLNGQKTVLKGGKRIENLINTVSSSYASAVTGSELYFEVISSGQIQKVTSQGTWSQSSVGTFITASFTNSIIGGFNRFVGIGGDNINETKTVNSNTSQKYLPVSKTGYNDTTLPLTIQPYDVITFLTKLNNYEEFLILNVSSGSSLVHLELDRSIDLSDMEASGYSIRRYVDDAAYILLDTNKPGGGTSGGILRPKYMGPDVEKKIGKVIDDLKSKNLI